MNDNFNIEDDEYLLNLLKYCFSTNVITVLNMPEFIKAKLAIHKIISAFKEITEDPDEVPEFSINYDKLYGTSLALRVVIPEAGFTTTIGKVSEILQFIPSDCVIDTIPRTDSKILMTFTFPKVKEIIDHEEKEGIIIDKYGNVYLEDSCEDEDI